MLLGVVVAHILPFRIPQAVAYLPVRASQGQYVRTVCSWLRVSCVGGVGGGVAARSGAGMMVMVAACPLAR